MVENDSHANATTKRVTNMFKEKEQKGVDAELQTLVSAWLTVANEQNAPPELVTSACVDVLVALLRALPNPRREALYQWIKWELVPEVTALAKLVVKDIEKGKEGHV